jgi:hypothetical protein
LTTAVAGGFTAVAFATGGSTIAVSTATVAFTAVAFATGAVFTGRTLATVLAGRALATVLAGRTLTALFALLATGTAALAAWTIFTCFAALYGASLLAFAALSALFAGWALAAGSAVAATFTATTVSTVATGLTGSALFTGTLFTLYITFGLLEQHLARQAELALIVNAEQLHLNAVAFLVQIAWILNALPVHF